MDFVFQGFQSGLPVWFFLLLFLITSGMAWWSYKNITALSPVFRYVLITLRSLMFFVLLLLLLNPFFQSETVEEIRPEIQVLFDNSASTSFEKGTYEGERSYRQAIDELNFQDSSDVAFHFLSFSSQVNPSPPESLTFDENQTHLYSAVENIKNNEGDLRGAILFSDGIYTRGQNPEFLSRELEVPVITVALGDTSSMQDLIVRNVITNSTGYLNTPQTVEANISSNGYPQTSFEVELLSSDGEVIDTQTVTPESETTSQSVEFTLEPEEEGLQQYEINIPALDGEWSVENNTQPFSIEVLDARQKILHLAFEVHPDVKMVRSILSEDENTQLDSYTWVTENRFIEGALNVDPDTLDLVILQGFPEGELDESLQDQLDELLQEVSFATFSTPAQPAAGRSRLQEHLLITAEDTPSYSESGFRPAAEPDDHSVMELPEITFNRLPPLYAPDEAELISGAQLLFTSDSQASGNDIPLIAVQETGNRRKAQVEAFGWYRLFQSGNDEVREYLETLFFNLLSWTAEQPDNRRLEFEPDQQMFSGNDPVSFTAFLTNEGGNEEAEGLIDVRLTGEAIDSNQYSMENEGGGQYSLNVGTLPEGVFEYEAVARKGEREIDRRTGEFSVSSSSEEFVQTIRDDELLRNIAGNSGGSFFTFEEAGAIRSEMENLGWLEPDEQTYSDTYYPYQHIFWFLVVMMLLSGEWLLRKYAALP